ncbi:Hypothetical predicted protein [Mytilus galloprovincialis]|uniref:NAD-dependent epimerase/dehydratase domain-containing protein n=1 Tax=Mytilus galloprovincialis TaxID=29158 RepID=A0A8B6HBX5_MYTGA|nr:Hypothetical predicted protein [Mytilus galloprovincialis]
MGLLISFLILCSLVLGTNANDVKKVLMFGGNGLIGAASVNIMLENGHDLTLVTRGNWYWDTDDNIKPRVKHLKCDRMKSLTDCWSAEQYDFYDAIVDFSGFDPYMIKDTLKLLQGRVGRYIYISSDSVYEVCTKNHSRPTVETDSVRPGDIKEQDVLNKKDDYGHRKYSGEEVLVEQRKQGGMPYFFIRLPDVIGSRDNTYRWWIYQAWLRLSPYLETKIAIPKNLIDFPMSFVYVEDVANIVLQSLNYDQDLLDEAYNFAFDETPTLPEVLEIMKKYMEKLDIDIPVTDDEDVLHLFPSVTRGPICCDKAKHKLGFKPTSFEQAAKETVEFYEQAMLSNKFERERLSVIQTLETFSPNNPGNVYIGLRKEYGLDIKSREEL